MTILLLIVHLTMPFMLRLHIQDLCLYHVSDLKYWECAPAKVYGVRSIPSNFLIDPQGKIIAIDLRGKDLGDKLAQIFGK